MVKHKCAGQVWGHMTYYRCDKTGRYEHEGKWWCKMHHPPTKQAKQQARNEKWKAEFDAQVRAREQARLAQDEMRRKADAYDGLVAERDALRSLLNDAVRDAEWKDKRIFPLNFSEPYQNWAATVWLPVPLSESDKSPEAALERIVSTAIAKGKKK